MVSSPIVSDSGWGAWVAVAVVPPVAVAVVTAVLGRPVSGAIKAAVAVPPVVVGLLVAATGPLVVSVEGL